MIVEKVVAERLKMLRLASNLSQASLAKTLGSHQNAISKIENAQGGSLNLFFQLVTFYSQTFYLGNLFSNWFDIVLLSDFQSDSFKFRDVMKEQLEQLKSDVTTKVDAIESLLDGR